jgi:hypothetical protein
MCKIILLHHISYIEPTCPMLQPVGGCNGPYAPQSQSHSMLGKNRYVSTSIVLGTSRRIFIDNFRNLQLPEKRFGYASARLC